MKQPLSPDFFTPSAATAIAPRLDIYAGIHKGLRAMMMDTLADVGRVDVHDTAGLHAVCERVLALGDACTSHLEHENHFVHPAMEAKHPGSTAQVAAEHKNHLAAIAELCATAHTLRMAGNVQVQLHVMQALYRKLALFVAENFVHMHAEELEHNPLLWASYSDEELQALEGRIAASLSPAQHLLFMRWMVPAIAPAERTALLAGLRAAAPATVLAAVLSAVQPHLGQRDWNQLTSALAAGGPRAPHPLAAAGCVV